MTTEKTSNEDGGGEESSSKGKPEASISASSAEVPEIQTQTNDNNQNDNDDDDDESMENLRASNWSGCIPVSLSLAPTSLFSPTIPPPIHVLVSRNTFLHVGLNQAVMRLHKFAPPTLFASSKKMVVEEPDETTSSRDNDDKNEEEKKKIGESGDAAGAGDGGDSHRRNEEKSSRTTASEEKEDFPICWFEDEGSELPLRWQFFAGVLFDSHRNAHTHHSDNRARPPELPWKIRVHFNQYPSSQLLPLEQGHVLTVIEKKFKHSLKQALVLQHGNNKVALNMTKQSHQQLWDSISSGHTKYSMYKLIRDDIQVRVSSRCSSSTTINNIPVRLLYGNTHKPLIQKRIVYKGNENSNNNNSGNDDGNDELCTIERLTLGSLLLQWASPYFEIDTTTKAQQQHDDDQGGVVVVPKYPKSTSWRIGGVVPPLSTNLIDLWKIFCHPDSFLYIVLITNH